MFRSPDEPTTPQQWQVIAWGLIVVCVAAGVIGFWYSLHVPPGKAEVARGIRWYSLACWTMAVAIYGVKRLFERFFS